MKRINSNSSLIDKKVFWSMAVCTAISLSILAFRIKNFEPCATVEIGVKPGPLYAGEMIQFRALTDKGENNVRWDFGDTRKNGLVVNHTFDLPGRYEVLLNTGSHCTGYRTIYVMEAPLVVDETLIPTFTGPLTVELGAPAVFEDNTPHASKWEWRFGETNVIDATEQRPTYTFKSEGQKTVILIVNEKLHGQLKVLVTPRTHTETEIVENPPEDKKSEDPMEVVVNGRNQPEPFADPTGDIEKAEIKFPDVSLRQLEVILEGIVEGKKEIADLYAYACAGKDMQVTYNGDLVNLIQLQRELRDIKSKKKIRKITITTEKDPLRNCINTMDISLKKKLL